MPLSDAAYFVVSSGPAQVCGPPKRNVVAFKVSLQISGVVCPEPANPCGSAVRIVVVFKVPMHISRRTLTVVISA